jgi:hypothetical protein
MLVENESDGAKAPYVGLNDETKRSDKIQVEMVKSVSKLFTDFFPEDIVFPLLINTVRLVIRRVKLARYIRLGE